LRSCRARCATQLARTCMNNLHEQEHACKTHLVLAMLVKSGPAGSTGVSWRDSLHQSLSGRS
jgi:hypothetical protein